MSSTLVLIRHAEAEYSWQIPDIARPLTARGHEQSRNLGRLLVERGIVFDKLYVSAAQRTLETAQGLREFHPSMPMHIRDELYLPSLPTINDITYELENEACVGILIHEPTVSEAGLYYAKDNAALNGGVQVATAVILTWEGSWAQIERGSADLTIVCGS